MGEEARTAADEFRDVLRDLLKRSGLAQNQYARRLGISAGRLSKIINVHQLITRERLDDLIGAADRGPLGRVPDEVREHATELLAKVADELNLPRRASAEKLRRSRDRSLAETSQLRSQSDTLELEVARSRHQLRELSEDLGQVTEALEAERRSSAERQDRIRVLEQRLVDMAKHAPRPPGPSLEDLQAVLERSWSGSRGWGADKLLMSAAMNLSAGDIVLLRRRLIALGRVREAELLVRDSARALPLGCAATLVEELCEEDLDRPESQDHIACRLLRHLGENRSLNEVLELHARWRVQSGPLRVRGWDDMIGAWMHGWRTAEERAHLFEVLAQDPDATKEAWANATGELKYLDVADQGCGDLLLILAQRDHAPWVRTVIGSYFDRDRLVVPDGFWRTVQESEDTRAQDVILREAAVRLDDMLLFHAARYMWEQVQVRGMREFLRRFLDHVISADVVKAQHLLEQIKGTEMVDTYGSAQERTNTVQLFDGLLYKHAQASLTVQ
ncbi:hypothetical protein ACTVZO_42390 [Streptomyces sp. IBSNAI002]|uniref:hypothetical protein n=1 Tax=Streptomyces sp. IBSNAI002 TaxID=3457500 RepID=UPI003FD69B1B